MTAPHPSRFTFHVSHFTLPPPHPVAVRLLRTPDDHPDLPTYHGVSYCDAVRRASQGQVLRVLPGAIEVCGWSPVILGLKPPAGRFEAGLEPRLPYPAAGLLLAPLDRCPGQPDLVLVRGEAVRLGELIAGLGPGARWDGHGGQLDRSALPLLAAGGASPRSDLTARGVSPRSDLIQAVNRALAALAPSARWQALTRRLFRSRALTAGFDALISRTLADMSICRNATVIPLRTGRVNLSFFCTGGITWGGNDPGHLVAGWPWPRYLAACAAGLPDGQAKPGRRS